MEINQLYTELIKEHSMDKSKKRSLDDKTDSELGFNPSCGDELILNLKIEDGIIKDATYEGVGCAISQASTSMMIDVIKGKTIEDAKKVVEIFLKMIKNEITDEKELEKLQDAIVLKNISKLPARVKCAVLTWRTLENMLEEK